MVRVACIGEAMIEMSLHEDTADLAVAGDTLNTAVYLKRCAPKIEVDYITRLGMDPFSERIQKFIASEELGGSKISLDPVAVPGLYAITLSASGERSFTYWRSASAARNLFADGVFSMLEGYDLIYLSGISLAILPNDVRRSLIAFLRTARQRVAYDNNHRPRLWDVEEAQKTTTEFWSFADIALPSLDDEMAIFGESEEEVIARFSNYSMDGALKCGQGGPVSIGEVVEQVYPAAKRVVDTTAAGDSFNGGYLAARLSGESQAAALQAGHEMAAKVVGFRGAIIPKSAV
ncbi:MAG: sugar kinase [Boseongicola sp.]|nr:sugar kinase [Boseongicola sp.]